MLRANIGRRYRRSAPCSPAGCDCAQSGLVEDSCPSCRLRVALHFRDDGT